MSIACEPLVAIWLSTSTTESSICCKQVAEKHHGEHLKIYVCSKGGGGMRSKICYYFCSVSPFLQKIFKITNERRDRVWGGGLGPLP